MENLVKEKETKRRFFRRTGLFRAQRSLDSSNCSSPCPSHSPSLENNSIVLSSSGIPASSSSSSFPLAAGINAPAASTSFGGSNSNVVIGNYRASGASSSLDETVINNKVDQQNRRFMAVPRRARSAERFDGMRIAFNNSPGGSEDVALAGGGGGGGGGGARNNNNFSNSPQLARLGGSVNDVGRRTVNNAGGEGGAQTPTMGRPGSMGGSMIVGGVQTPTMTRPGNVTGSGIVSGVGTPTMTRPGTGSSAQTPTIGRSANGSAVQTPTLGSMPSPPPPYTAVTDITGPPSYRQAVAAMTASAQQQAAQGNRPSSANKAHPRYTMANRSTQSFDISGPGYTPGGSLRSASSVPTFSDEVLCRCAKCQAFQRPGDMNNCGDYNDAVYMESQAFLMHEIMTDGMAFCSVM